jgi:prophage antirepressor-like protein
MSNLAVFKFSSNNVRVVMINGEPWFIARDVLEALGSKSRSNDVKAMVEEDLGEGYVTVVPLETAGGEQQVVALSEAALTMVVSRSRTELGKAMNRWIHTEVLPSIRKTGGYGKQQCNLIWFERLKLYKAKTKIPVGWFSIFEEMTHGLIAEFEHAGYSLPDGSIPDISVGKHFCKYLRGLGYSTEKGSDVVQAYKHFYPDGRVVDANIYRDVLLAEYRRWFQETYKPHHLPQYMKGKDPASLPTLCGMLGLPEGSV